MLVVNTQHRCLFDFSKLKHDSDLTFVFFFFSCSILLFENCRTVQIFTYQNRKFKQINRFFSSSIFFLSIYHWLPYFFVVLVVATKLLIISLFLSLTTTDSESESGSHKSIRKPSSASGDGKPTRVRTVLNEKQLHTLR